MIIPLPLHLFIHLFLAVLVGYLAGNYFKSFWLTLITGIIGGFFIDLDHVLEYLLAFNWHFNIIYFLQGRQFLVTDKVHLWFHAWEYIPVILLLAWIFKKKKTVKIFLITLAIAMSVHLLTDVVINQVPLKFYTLTYRSSLEFSVEKLMSPEGYQENQDLKRELGM